MFGRKRDNKPESKEGKGVNDLSQFGFLNPMGGGPDDVDDADLEAELALLAGESSSTSAPSRSSRGTKRPSPASRPVADLSRINKLALDSMKDIDIDDDISDSEDDPDLLAELADLSAEEERPVAESYQPHQTTIKQSPQQPAASVITDPPGGAAATDPVSLVDERLENYKTALKNAQAANESSKARRINRGLKTLNDLSKKLKSGRLINVDDIPPQVALGVSTNAAESVEPVKLQEPVQQPEPIRRPEPVRPQEPVQQQEPTVQTEPKPSLSASALADLHRRRNEYKQAALLSKRNNDLNTAREMFKISKQFDQVIAAAEKGLTVDLTKMPQSPSVTNIQTAPPTGGVVVDEEVPVADADVKKVFNAPEKPTSTLEALHQRLEKYQSGVESAKSEGNSGKSRRMGRIVKQYQDAIKRYQSGKTVDFSELPAPPGFDPIPADSPGGATAEAHKQSPTPPPQQKMNSPAAVAAAAAPPQQKVTSPKPRLPSKLLQQLAFLSDRQKQFKMAALKAKNSGDMVNAREYLRSAKGFDSMIEAVSKGLKIDMSDVPRPPGLEEEDIEGFEFVETSDVTGAESGEELMSSLGSNREEMFKRLEQELIIQMKQCSNNCEHYTQIGDVVNARKFEKMAQNTRKDLDALKNAYRHGDPVPRFHYENRSFTMVQCCTDLGEMDLQVVIVRGLQYSSELDSYVKFEFPYPSSETQKFESATCKSSNSPEYDESFKVDISRKSKACLRIIKLKSLKFEVYFKRGFFKGDKFLGSIAVQLQPLEDKCEIHECLDLLDGRRPCGGKLEVKIRVRDPFVNKQIETVDSKWLVLDTFTRNVQQSPIGGAQQQSVEVLRYEKKLLNEKIEKYRSKLSPTQIDNLKKASSNIENQIIGIQNELKQKGADGYRSYANDIELLISAYTSEAQQQLKSGKREKAQITMTKKKLVEREIQTINSKLTPKSQICAI